MTRISFLHSAPDRIQAAVQWLQRAWARRETVLVYAPDEDTAQRLDHSLWAQPAISFIPHCRGDSPLAPETAIIITGQLDVAPQEDCLINLSNELPVNFSRFTHIVEIVSTDDADRQPARERYKHYRDNGCTIENQDISGGL